MIKIYLHEQETGNNYNFIVIENEIILDSGIIAGDNLQIEIGKLVDYHTQYGKEVSIHRSDNAPF